MGHTGALLHTQREGTDNQSDRCLAHWDTIYCIQKVLATRQGEGGGRQRAQTTKQTGDTDRGHTQWGTLGHCQLCIQRSQTTSQTIYRVDSAPVGPCLTGCLCSLYIQLILPLFPSVPTVCVPVCLVVYGLCAQPPLPPAGCQCPLYVQ